MSLNRFKRPRLLDKQEALEEDREKLEVNDQKRAKIIKKRAKKD